MILIINTSHPKEGTFTACEPTTTGIDTTNYRWVDKFLEYEYIVENGYSRWHPLDPDFTDLDNWFATGAIFLTSVRGD